MTRPCTDVPPAVACLLAAALTLSGAALAADPVPAYTIEELQLLAYDNNGLVRSVQQEVAASQAGVNTASAYPNPELDLLQGKLRPRRTGGLSGDENTLILSQRLENPWMRRARIDSAEAFAGSRRALLESAINDVAAEVRVRAYAVILRQEEARAASDALTLLEQTRKRVRVRVEQGEAGRYDLIRAEAEELNARQRRDAALLEVDRARIAVNQLLGGILPAKFDIRSSLSDGVRLLPLAELQQQALVANPEFVRLQAELQQYKARVAQERAAILPGADVLVGQTRGVLEDESHIGLSIPIPIWDRRKGPIGEATANMARVDTQLDNRRKLIVQEMDAAVQAYRIAQRQVEALESAVLKDAEAAVRVAEAAYRFGERGILDYLDAQRVLRLVRAELNNARFNLQAAAAEIDRLRAAYPRRTAK
jgi:cobalt-zinc-cadmium efflux system outer membrane protein